MGLRDGAQAPPRRRTALRSRSGVTSEGDVSEEEAAPIQVAKRARASAAAAQAWVDAAEALADPDEDARASLENHLLGLRLTQDAIPAHPPPLPQDGRFIDVEQYVGLWEQVVVSETEAQVFEDVADAAPIAVFRDADSAECEWRLELLTGEWVPESGGGMSICAGPSGLLVTDSSGWRACLTPPDAARWRTARHGEQDVFLRLRDWNTLELQTQTACKQEIHSCQPLRRAPADLHPGCVVRLQLASSEEERLGVVERRHEAPVVRFMSGAAPIAARVAAISTVLAGHELHAVRSVGNLQPQLLADMLGKTPATSRSGKKLKAAARLPCLAELNTSQLGAVEAACQQEAGFTLIWGPPGTGKSMTVLALINALHVWEYERFHDGIERLVLGADSDRTDDFSADDAQWRDALRCAPRLLITASSESAVEALLERVCAKKFLDRQGNTYEPWGSVRVGAPSTVGASRSKSAQDVDSRVQALLDLPPNMVLTRLTAVRGELSELRKNIRRLRKEIQAVKKVAPLPLGWEPRLTAESGMRVEFHDHDSKRATFKRPPTPRPGAPCLQLLDFPCVIQRLGQLMQCADRFWQLQSESQRLSWLHERATLPESRPLAALRRKLEGSFLGSAHLVFATLSSAARLLPYLGQMEPFGAVVCDEAAQATEPAMLVAASAGNGSRRVVLVGDDRQLSPSLFHLEAERALVGRTLFERLRQLGRPAALLEEQYRMAPEISAFPRRHFYGGALRDAPGAWDRTRRKLHDACPPLVFLDLGASKPRRRKDVGGSSGHRGYSWDNPEEARLCAKILLHLRAAARPLGEAAVAESVSVITFYAGQVETLRKELRVAAKEEPWRAGAVQAVADCQGRESEVVVISAVRAPDGAAEGHGVGFMAEERRLNLALTRAKTMLIVVGHAESLSKSPSWAALIRHVRGGEGFYQHIASASGDEPLRLRRPEANAADAPPDASAGSATMAAAVSKASSMRPRPSNLSATSGGPGQGKPRSNSQDLSWSL